MVMHAVIYACLLHRPGLISAVMISMWDVALFGTTRQQTYTTVRDRLDFGLAGKDIIRAPE